MLVKTEAIVLHTIKYGEQRVIVDMFTREQGRLSFIVSLPHSAHGKFRKQYFQPLTLLTIEADVRQQVQLQKLREISVTTPLPSLLTQPDKLSIALFMAEFLFHALRDEQQDMALFDYVSSSIEWLDSSPRHYANFHLMFLMRLSRFLGFYPNLESRNQGLTESRSFEAPYFDLRAASFCETAPTHRDFLMPQEAAHISTLMRMDFATMHLFQLSRAERNRILEILLTYYRLHLPSFPELHSVEVLRELYA